VDERFTKPSGWAARWKCFGFALRGLRVLIATQWNARIHAAITLLVVALGFLLGISAAEWCALIFAAALVWTTEAMNTALEFALDAVSPGYHEWVGRAKDLAAGAVLVAVTCAVLIGLIVLGPPLWKLLGG
jgi:diacylglycerol kinase